MVRKLQQTGLLAKPPPWWTDPPAWMRDLPWWLRRTLHKAGGAPMGKGFEREHGLQSLEREHRSYLPKVLYGGAADAAAPAPHPRRTDAHPDASAWQGAKPRGGQVASAWLPFGRGDDAIVEALRRNEL